MDSKQVLISQSVAVIASYAVAAVLGYLWLLGANWLYLKLLQVAYLQPPLITSAANVESRYHRGLPVLGASWATQGFLSFSLGTRGNPAGPWLHLWLLVSWSERLVATGAGGQGSRLWGPGAT